MQQKGEEGVNPLSSWAGKCIVSWLWMWELLVLGPSDSWTYTSSSQFLGGPGTELYHWLPLGWIIPLAFQVVQLSEGRLWDFSASITAWTNSYNKSPLTSIYLPWLIQSYLKTHLVNDPPHWYIWTHRLWSCKRLLKLPNSSPLQEYGSLIAIVFYGVKFSTILLETLRQYLMLKML